MKRGSIGLGDLARALAATAPQEWPWVAAALGWPEAAQAEEAARLLARLKAAAAPAGPQRGAEAPIASIVTPPPAPAPAGAAPEQPRQVFWRVASDLIDPELQQEAPAWAVAGPVPTAAEFDGDAHRPPPPPPVPLVRAGQAANFLRRQLARPRPDAALDVPRLARAFTRQQALRSAPRRMRQRWPARVRLVYDTHPRLGPLHEDLRALARQMGRLLGPRLSVCLTAGRPGDWRDIDGQPVTLAADGCALVVLSDAGLLQPGSGQPARWAKVARALGGAGAAPLLLAPVPRRLATHAVAAAFRLALLGDGPTLRTVRPGRLPVAEAPAQAPSALDAAAPEPAGGATGDAAAADVALLRAAIFGNPWVTPALLRALRLTLNAQGHLLDVAAEAALWCDPAVGAHDLACTLRHEARASAAQDLQALPDPLRAALAMVHWQHLQAASPLARAEYARAVQALLPADSHAAAVLAAGRAAADRLAERACTALLRATAPWVHGLAAYLARLGLRDAAVVMQGGEALQAAWALAHRQALAEGRVAPLPGLDLARIAWALARDDGDTRRVELAVLGVPGQGGDAPPRWVLQVHEPAAAAPAPSSALLRHLASRWTQVRIASARPDAGAEVWLAEDRPVELDAAHPVELRNAARISVIEPFTKPAWARAVRFDGGDWQALAPDGRWLTWRPRFRYALGLGRLPEPSAWLPPSGAWVDDAQGRGPDRFDDAVLSRPQWASAHGLDEQGPWAEVVVSGRHGTATQRFRWIPPGEFWMGSPDNEPERSETETRHRVVLTQGFWLADTACTQALWQAVLGENPSWFKDDPENPVEQVSWNEITERFLPELNRMVPGLQACLPTEAQWEYACRAGTETPFWFGDQITPEQVNYAGNVPYNKGPEGEWRQRTVPVKALPANGWGLYQMHGNVWEWCQDEFTDYPNGPAIDPNDPRILQEQGIAAGGRQRVLRGGSWINDGGHCRSAIRRAIVPDERGGTLGFRLARGLAEPAGPEAQAGGAGGMGQRAEPAQAPPRAERGEAPGTAQQEPKLPWWRRWVEGKRER